MESPISQVDRGFDARLGREVDQPLRARLAPERAVAADDAGEEAVEAEHRQDLHGRVGRLVRENGHRRRRGERLQHLRDAGIRPRVARQDGVVDLDEPRERLRGVASDAGRVERPAHQQVRRPRRPSSRPRRGEADGRPTRRPAGSRPRRGRRSSRSACRRDRRRTSSGSRRLSRLAGADRVGATGDLRSAERSPDADERAATAASVRRPAAAAPASALTPPSTSRTTRASPTR